MTIEDHRAELTRLVAERPRRADQPYDEEIRRVGVAYARACRREGQTWAHLASAVPLSSTTLANWVAAAEEATENPKHLVPIQVVEAGVPGPPREVGEVRSGTCPVLVSPGGYRLVGLTVEQAVTAFRMLG